MEKEKQKTERKEHILVCLSFSPSNEKIIRTAAQMARAFGANFTALYVQTAEPAEKTPEDQARLQKHIRLAEQSGAEIVTTHSEDIALQIAEYARISEVTRIVIGKSMMDQGFFRKRRGWTERLTDLVPDLEIHIIPDSNIITIYLVGVMMTSILTSGYTCSVISSVISVVLFNYFLTEPRLTLYAYGSGYPVTFAIMLGISILTGTLASKLKENAKLSARDAFRTKILFNTSQLLQKAEDASEIFDITATKLVKLLGRDLTAAPAGAQESRIVRGTLYSAQTGGKTEKIFDLREQEIIQWVLDSRKRGEKCLDRGGGQRPRHGRGYPGQAGIRRGAARGPGHRHAQYPQAGAVCFFRPVRPAGEMPGWLDPDHCSPARETTVKHPRKNAEKRRICTNYCW